MSLENIFTQSNSSHFFNSVFEKQNFILVKLNVSFLLMNVDGVELRNLCLTQIVKTFSVFFCKFYSLRYYL